MKKQRKLPFPPYLWIPVVYIALGVTWILSTGKLQLPVSSLFDAFRTEDITLDAVFVAISALVLYVTFRTEFRRYAGLLDEQQQTEEVLRDVFKKYQDLTTLSPVALFTLDVDGNCIDVSPRWQAVTGQPLVSALGRGWQAPIHPEDREKLEPNLTSLSKRGEPVHAQFRLALPDQKVTWVNATILPSLSETGSLHGYIGSLVDISDTKAVEQQAQYQANLLENVSDAIISTDNEGRIVSWNRAAEAMYGYTFEEARGQLATQLLRSISLSDQGGGSGPAFWEGTWNGELIQRTKSGDSIYVLMSANQLRDTQDRDSGLVVIYRDITARHNAETELVASKTMYQTVFEHSPVGIGLVEKTGNVITINKALHRITGFTAEEIATGSNANTFFYDANSKPIKIGKLAKKSAQGGAEAQLTRKDGSQIDAVVTLTEVQYQGTPCWHVIIQDVTQRKKMEEALRESETLYRTVFETSSIGLAIADQNGMIMRVNSAILDPGGYSRDDIIAEPSVGRLYHDPGARKAILERFGRGESIDRVPVKFRRKDGTPYDTLLTLRTVTLNGKPCLHAIVEDVTQQRIAADRLRELTGRLTNAQEEERRRVARELHDAMGQALSAAKLRLKVLKDDIPDNMPSLMEQAHVLGGIIDETLVSVRSLSHELMPPLLDEFGWHAALEALCESFPRRTGLEVEFSHTGDITRLSPTVELAAYRVAQEALTNALRHAKATHVAVKSRLAHGALEVTIKDDGSGFEVSKVRSTREGGPGLGLLSMQERTVSAGGELEIKSEPRQGTSVTARFPAQGENGETDDYFAG